MRNLGIEELRSSINHKKDYLGCMGISFLEITNNKSQISNPPASPEGEADGGQVNYNDQNPKPVPFWLSSRVGEWFRQSALAD